MTYRKRLQLIRKEANVNNPIRIYIISIPHTQKVLTNRKKFAILVTFFNQLRVLSFHKSQVAKFKVAD